MQFVRLSMALLCALALAPLSARAENNAAAPKVEVQKFEAIIVWATDDEKPPEKEEELKPIEPELKEKMKFFKWKNYFQVGDRKHIEIRPGETREIHLSHKCRIKLCESVAQGLEIELIGEGKSVWKKNQSMPLKDVLIIGGDDRNATAWMVVLKPE